MKNVFWSKKNFVKFKINKYEDHIYRDVQFGVEVTIDANKSSSLCWDEGSFDSRIDAIKAIKKFCKDRGISIQIKE